MLLSRLSAAAGCGGRVGSAADRSVHPVTAARPRR